MKKSDEKKGAVLVSVTTSFISSFMGSALNLSIPDIEKDFAAGAAVSGWVITVYMLTCAALTVPFGRLAEIRRRTAILRAGIFLFAFASAAAFFSWNFYSLIAFRAIQGTGASMMFSTNMAVLVDAFDEEERGKVIGLSTASTYLGLAVGPLAGGSINHLFGWNMIFAVSAAVSAPAFFAAVKKLPPGKTGSGKIRDKTGMVLYPASVAGIMYGLSSVCVSEKWPYALAAGSVLMFFFIKTELKAKDPLLDIRAMARNSCYLRTNLSAMLCYGSVFAMNYLLSVYLQSVTGIGSGKAGVILVIPSALMAVLSPLSGKLSDRYPAHLMTSTGMAMCAGAMIMLMFLKEDSGLAAVTAPLVICGTGSALFMSPNARSVMSSVEREDHGVASSVLATMRSAGHTAAMAAVTSVTGAAAGNVSFEEAGAATVTEIVNISFFIFAAACILAFFMALKRKV